MEQGLTQIIILLGLAVAGVVIFQRLRIPSSLAYLLVGVILGPHTIGPALDAQQIKPLAEFGIVFLLFTIGLNFSLSRIHALRYQILALGLGQVTLTTAAITLVGWLLMGLPGAAAFVIGAVFTQSSTTIITRQLLEQGEENSRHGRLGTAMSVFQDVMAVPFLIIIPVLGTAAGLELFALATPLGLALGKALLVFLLVFLGGRLLLRPFFHAIATTRSAEIFTLTVLMVSLLAAWASGRLGLSMAFGAFLAGMVLGDTEFRPQVEATIRPFRDVLLGLFFVGIGMLFDLTAIPAVWQWSLLGAALLLAGKALVVVGITRRAGVDALTAWRVALLLAVGGEFGFALLAIAIGAGAIAADLGQIALFAVLFSMIVAPFIIRYNHAIAARLCGGSQARFRKEEAIRYDEPETVGELQDHVIICGYGRIGQNVGRLLEEEKIPYVALDLDPVKVREAHTAGEPVYYADSSEYDVLVAVGAERARLAVISHDDVPAALKSLAHLRDIRPQLPVMVRTRDQTHVDELLAAGATEVVPETVEAGLMIAAQALLLLDIPLSRIVRRMQKQRSMRYRLLRELFRGNELSDDPECCEADRLRAVTLHPYSQVLGRRLGELELKGVLVTALVREGKRRLSPAPDTVLTAGDVLVLFGTPDDLYRAEDVLLK